MAVRCASGCVVECRICNREVAGSNLGRDYFAPRSTQPSIPLGLVNEYQLWLGKQRQVWLIPPEDKTQGVQVKRWYPLTMCAIREHLRDVSCIGAIQININFTFYLIILCVQCFTKIIGWGEAGRALYCQKTECCYDVVEIRLELFDRHILELQLPPPPSTSSLAMAKSRLVSYSCTGSLRMNWKRI